MVKPTSDRNLQPSLLDRLSGDGRFLERVTLSFRPAALKAAGSTTTRVREMLERVGVRHVEGDEERAVFETTAHSRRWREILLLPAAPTAAAKSGQSLGDLFDVETVVKVPFENPNGPAGMGKREIRTSVMRNIDWLLNSLQLLDDDDDAEALPEVARSVLNYGIPALAGLTPGSIDVPTLGSQIRVAIERFEPRLLEVDVRLMDSEEAGEEGEIAFVIHGRCWGPDSHERLDLKTTLFLDNGRFQVNAGGG